MKNPNMTRRAVLACIAVFIITGAAGRFDPIVSWMGRHDEGFRLVLLSLFQAVLLVVATVYLVKSSRQGSKQFLKRRRFRMKWLPVTLFAALTATLGSMILNAAALKLPFLAEYAQQSSLIYRDKDFTQLFFALAFLPAVSEELFFRGAVLSSYQNRSYSAAVFGSAFLFALLHASPYNLIGPFFAGMIYALLALLFDSVYPALLAHLINNTLTTLTYVYYDRIKAVGLDAYLFISLLVAFLLCAYLALLLCEAHIPKIRLAESGRHLKERIRKSAHSPFFSLELLAFVILWSVLVVLSAQGYW